MKHSLEIVKAEKRRIAESVILDNATFRWCAVILECPNQRLLGFT